MWQRITVAYIVSNIIRYYFLTTSCFNAFVMRIITIAKSCNVNLICGKNYLEKLLCSTSVSHSKNSVLWKKNCLSVFPRNFFFANCKAPLGFSTWHSKICIWSPFLPFIINLISMVKDVDCLLDFSYLKVWQESWSFYIYIVKHQNVQILSFKVIFIKLKFMIIFLHLQKLFSLLFLTY